MNLLSAQYSSSPEVALLCCIMARALNGESFGPKLKCKKIETLYLATQAKSYTLSL